MKPQSPQTYVSGVLEGNRRMLAKTITLIESALPEHRALARTILDQLLPYTGKSIRLGITGVPGVGKSTFIESLGMMLVEKGHQVAVLAVDPSSTRSGGSVMADKTRMEKLSVHPSAYIRPSPSGGTLGGVARTTRETMLVCEAAGFDVLIVETMGVGQSEIKVASMVDFFLVLMLAGAGDELQGIKKGVLEMADALAINKADGQNIQNAQKAREAYETALSLLRPSSASWKPPVLICSALEMSGIEDIWNTVLEHRKRLAATGEFKEKRRRQALEWMWSIVEEGLKERFYQHPDIKRILKKVTKEVEKGMTAPPDAAYALLSLLDDRSCG
ncbi:MAG: methylmalonyl Co-A mutase-associated GTPase MeaB [Deltaproteobacteria bacterium]|nr:methylmalonyl Co-A mutase-associated GTPase MeaB [Deltaproteobacteria bacterium]MBW1961984.1 methylmalonyl Co-A mutase-associated GTPase MeaB [Deltaproteobacteria bacterium]MBW1993829.1 methylmalonyl Co-A mutase-associated GTPase MeaB [Deltaproteobacteria bacterium]MBW2153901.1 methylmalonyl Co-A mutase-associated GTPase MeaB [Deltaproteobacteria bacterium]